MKSNFQGQQLAIVEAIELATQLRAKARFYKELASSEKEEIQFGYAESTISIPCRLIRT